MVGGEGTVPERVGGADDLYGTCEGARGLRREREEEEMGLVWVVGEKLTSQKGGVE